MEMQMSRRKDFVPGFQSDMPPNHPCPQISYYLQLDHPVVLLYAYPYGYDESSR